MNSARDKLYIVALVTFYSKIALSLRNFSYLLLDYVMAVSSLKSQINWSYSNGLESTSLYVLRKDVASTIECRLVKF